MNKLIPMELKATNVLVPFDFCLTGEQKEAIIQNSNIVKYNKKEIIFRQNTRTSHIMFVKSGMVKIFKEGRNNKFIWQLIRSSLSPNER